MKSERIMIAIDNLITARIELEAEKNKEPSYPLQIDNAEDKVRNAQYKLTMALDNIKFRD